LYHEEGGSRFLKHKYEQNILFYEHGGVEFGTFKIYRHSTSNGFAAPLEGPTKEGRTGI
jgi:hypothetical protein